MAAERFDVVIIGAGIVGSALAMGLAERGLTPLAFVVNLSGHGVMQSYG